MGSVTISPREDVEAGFWQTFTLVYTAGRFGIDDTGSLKIGLRFATDFGPIQFSDPKAPEYTSAEASNGATLEAKWEFKRNIRPWSRSLHVGVVKDFLAPGDTITIRFGDRRQGSPSVRIQTYCENAFEFHVLVDAVATYDYVALPASPTIKIIPGPGVRWFALLPTLVRAGVRALQYLPRLFTSGATPIPLVQHALGRQSWHQFRFHRPNIQRHAKRLELLPVSRTPGLGVMMKLEVADDTTDFQSGV